MTQKRNFARYARHGLLVAMFLMVDGVPSGAEMAHSPAFPQENGISDPHDPARTAVPMLLGISDPHHPDHPVINAGRPLGRTTLAISDGHKPDKVRRESTRAA